jgi:hypothetical protein
MRSFFLLAIIIILASCKAPLPVYFDKPVGIVKDTFPEMIQGNYYPMDDIISKGLMAYEGKYAIKNGKIVLRDTSKTEIKSSSDLQKDSATVNKKTKEIAAEENNFNKIASLNSLTLTHIDSAVDVIDKEKKIAFAFIKISKNKISVVIKDSLENDQEALLIQLNEKIKLTVFSDDYYLNIQTPYGWEFLKIEAWNNGEFLNMIPFYFTNYNDKTGDVNVFLKSTAAIYPGLKPIYNPEHFIIGLKGITNPQTVKEKFKGAENNLELIKVKE